MNSRRSGSKFKTTGQDEQSRTKGHHFRSVISSMRSPRSDEARRPRQAMAHLMSATLAIAELRSPLPAAVERAISGMQALCGERLDEVWIQVLSRKLFGAAEQGLAPLEAAVQEQFAAIEHISGRESDLKKALLYWIQGECRQVVAKPAEAATPFLEAGRRLNWQDEPEA